MHAPAAAASFSAPALVRRIRGAGPAEQVRPGHGHDRSEQEDEDDQDATARNADRVPDVAGGNGDECGREQAVGDQPGHQDPAGAGEPAGPAADGGSRGGQPAVGKEQQPEQAGQRHREDRDNPAGQIDGHQPGMAGRP